MKEKIQKNRKKVRERKERRNFNSLRKDKVRKVETSLTIVCIFFRGVTVIKNTYKSRREAKPHKLEL